MPFAVAEHIREVSEGETKVISEHFLDNLDTGELLVDTPTVTEIGTSDLTLANKAVSTATLTINGKSALAAQAVQFTVTGVKRGVLYHIKIVVDTDASAAQTFVSHVRIRGRAD